MASCMRADHGDYVEADVASAAACLAGYVKLTMGRPTRYARSPDTLARDAILFRPIARHDRRPVCTRNNVTGDEPFQQIMTLHKSNLGQRLRN